LNKTNNFIYQSEPRSRDYPYESNIRSKYVKNVVQIEEQDLGKVPMFTDEMRVPMTTTTLIRPNPDGLHGSRSQGARKRIRRG
jgi:hypothetical protein